MKKGTILILSPHLDDAALSCADHILMWKKNGYQVVIITYFSQFSSSSIIPAYSQKYIIRSGFSSIKRFAVSRRDEDRKAMRFLDVPFMHLGFVDGGFRSAKGLFLYPNSEALFSGSIALNDRTLLIKMTQLTMKIITSHKNVTLVCPIGIGGHADHLIVKKMAENIATRWESKILYYLDQPYGLLKRNWTIKLCLPLLFKKKSRLHISEQKRLILDCYKSQISIFPSRQKEFNEYIFG